MTILSDASARRLLMVVVVVAFGLGAPACGDADTGEDLKDLEEIALVPAGSTLIREEVDSETLFEGANISRHYAVPLLAEEIVQFYGSELPKRGWVLRADYPTVDPISQQWTRDGLRLGLIVDNDAVSSGPTDVRIVLTKQRGDEND